MTKPKNQAENLRPAQTARKRLAKPAARKRSTPTNVRILPREPIPRHARIIAMLRTPARRNDRLSRDRNRMAATFGTWFFLLESSVRNSGLILFQSKPTKVGSIASRMARLHPPPRTEPNRRPDAMQRKRPQWSYLY